MNRGRTRRPNLITFFFFYLSFQIFPAKKKKKKKKDDTFNSSRICTVVEPLAKAGGMNVVNQVFEGEPSMIAFLFLPFGRVGTKERKKKRECVVCVCVA